MNFAITDIFACVTSLFVMARLVPIGIATVQVSYGLCQYLTPKIRSLFIFMAIAYIPAFSSVFCFCFNQADTQTVYDLYYEIYPNDTSLSYSQFTGSVNTDAITGVVPMINMLFCPIPILVSVLLIRRMIVKFLAKTMEHLRKETKALHKQLLTALTLQACLPIFFGLGTVMFGLEASGTVRNPAVQVVISASECFIPVLSPILYLYYVSPYRRSLLRIAGVKPTVSVTEATITNHQSVVTKNDKKSITKVA
ncbi:unnamed protein product [Caenorhabditis angaria]|uniref:G-protein coupled receptors family 1 profile domain-containing protein n=1 Tax=Caenorhabditis angaria TaxID=860376 RepID=A0A9P1ITH5_9PELO|nr:unnamed protein product [Caenorhabditis angaria]